MRDTRPLTSDVEALVERQLRQWELGESVRAAEDAPEVHSFIAISRQAGAGASVIAVRLGESLGWPVFDRQILQAMSESDTLRQRLYEQLDERDATWLEGMLASLLLSDRPRDYRTRLTETLLAIVRIGPAILLGRAADLILPHEFGIRVRIVAPFDVRVQRYAAEQNIAYPSARRAVARIDRERAEFIRRHFRRGIDDPLRFDLVLNTDRFSPEAARQLILAALDRCDSVRRAEKHASRALRRE